MREKDLSLFCACHNNLMPERELRLFDTAAILCLKQRILDCFLPSCNLMALQSYAWNKGFLQTFSCHCNLMFASTDPVHFGVVFRSGCRKNCRPWQRIHHRAFRLTRRAAAACSTSQYFFFFLSVTALLCTVRLLCGLLQSDGVSASVYHTLD